MHAASASFEPVKQSRCTKPCKVVVLEMGLLSHLSAPHMTVLKLDGE